MFYLSIIGLISLGSGVSIGTFGLVRHVVTQALPYHNSTELVVVHDVYPRRDDQLLGMSEPEIADLRQLARSFTGIAVIEPGGTALVTPGGQRVSTTAVSSNLPSVLGIYPSRGRVFQAGDEDPASPLVALISEHLFKDIGQCTTLATCKITVNGLIYGVVGTLPSTFRLPGDLATAHQVDILLPLQPRSSQYNNRHNPRLTVVARLKPNVTLVEAQRDMSSVAEKLRNEYPAVYNDEGYLIHLRELSSSILGDTAFVLFMATLASSLLFTLTLTNAGTLLLIGSRKRSQAMLIALALGAPRSTLRLQLFIESFLVSVAGFGPGILLGFFLILFVARLSAGRLLPFLPGAYLSPETIAFAALLSLLGIVIILLIGQAPISRACGLLPTIHREVRTSTATRSSVLTQSLSVTLQMAVSTTLMALFLLVALSQYRLRDINLGFQPDNLVASEIELARDDFATNDSVLAFFDTLLPILRSQDGFEQSCLATFPPLIQKNETWPIEVLRESTAKSDTSRSVAVDVLSGGCLEVLGIPLLAGSDLPVLKDKGSQPQALVSQSFAHQMWPTESALGKLIRLNLKPNSPWVTVAGVVSDVHHEGPNSPTAPTVYLHYSDIPPLTTASVRFMRILTRTTRSGQDIRTFLQQLAASLHRSASVQLVGSVGDLLARVTAPWRFTGEVLGLVAIVGATIVVSGLYSLTLTLLTLRRKEFAIRTAIGASRRSILYLLERYMLLRIALGGILGIVSSLFLFERLSIYLPRIVLAEAAAAAAVASLSFLCISLIISACLLRITIGPAVPVHKDE
jgi:predicted permease